MLRSGNGQHRRPRQTPRIVLTVGVTGAGMALPLLTGGAAHAASVTTWDRVANCETGGTWGADRDDGLYGGLDLTQDVWDRYGGPAYAASPDLASRQEQIAVAQRLLDAQGPGYWTACAVREGLRQGGAAPDVDPGAPAGSGLLGGLLGSTGSAEPAPTASPSATSPAAPATPSSPAPTATGTGTGMAQATPTPTAPAPTASPASGSPSVTATATASPAPTASGSASGSRGGGRHAAPPAGPGGSTAGAGTYTVRPGDDLYEIATRHEVPGGWPALYAANASVVGHDPDLILPGQRITLDGAS